MMREELATRPRPQAKKKLGKGHCERGRDGIGGSLWSSWVTASEAKDSRGPGRIVGGGKRTRKKRK